MFYRIFNLFTKLSITADNMAHLGSDDIIISLVAQKLEGRCLPQHGYIIKIINKSNYEIGDPVVTKDGCQITVRFDAVTFKVNKNQILDCIVSNVSEQGIEGSLGHARVLIPKAYIDSNWKYRKDYGAFVDSNDDQLKIEKDVFVRFQVHESKIHMGHIMQIIGKMTRNHLGPRR